MMETILSLNAWTVCIAWNPPKYFFVNNISVCHQQDSTAHGPVISRPEFVTFFFRVKSQDRKGQDFHLLSMWGTCVLVL